MLKEIFKKLDNWIEEENIQATNNSFPSLKVCEFRVVGQNALLEAKLRLKIAATVDVDTIDNASHSIRAKLNELLKLEGLELDPLGNEIWMPEETRYVDIFVGKWLRATRALPVYILVSKAKFAVNKNKDLILQYLAHDPDPEFFDLCEKYDVDLNEFIRQ